MTNEWGYSVNNGPSTWQEKFPSARGLRQSPVDIVTSRTSCGECTLPLAWKYNPDHTRSLLNPGYGWRVDENGTDSELTGGPLGKDVYRLEQFHCHWGRANGVGSEHTVDGRSFSGELHLVHWNTTKYATFDEAGAHNDGLAVLAVFLVVGTKHEELDKVVQLLPYVTHKGDKITMPPGPLDPGLLLPSSRAYWTYPGSLTTPPCTECVIWILFKQPIQVSAEQLELMRLLRCADATMARGDGARDLQVLHNHRPPLPLGNRELRDNGGN